MIIDTDRHVSIDSYRDLFPYMSLSWSKHFERDEWVESVALAGDHVRVSDRFQHDAADSGKEGTPTPSGSLSLLLPHHGLTVNGWADQQAARVFLEAVNSYGAQHWKSETALPLAVVTAYDVEWSAAEIRRRAAAGSIGGVAVPLTTTLLGSPAWDPIYAACVETGLPLVIHFSGVEGRYAGAPALAGGVHANALSRLTIMPHLAESNITSLAYEGALVRFPDLRILFTGFGFSWLPSFLWRLDREWRTFRHDIPWVTEPPSQQVLTSMWFSTWPVGEIANIENWENDFTDDLLGRIVYGSHSPHHGDQIADVEAELGAGWSARLERNGAAALALPLTSEV
ncbi:amidohydrolase family protein [Rhodococcoides kyotonense]|uniref:Amidohydrolase n=1 Tax=Rhodococcoides kyotonense TaxID=398843 RepID=A0A239M2G9_9NOCA|nr:amidohydrolase family protein [Rhodococcus kyotonensis]SNT36124.1 Amidohydrolase [Rhodococcus kyotonensis]